MWNLRNPYTVTVPLHLVRRVKKYYWKVYVFIIHSYCIFNYLKNFKITLEQLTDLSLHLPHDIFRSSEQHSGTNSTSEATDLAKGSGRSIPNTFTNVSWGERNQRKPRQTQKNKITQFRKASALVGFKTQDLLEFLAAEHFHIYFVFY